MLLRDILRSNLTKSHVTQHLPPLLTTVIVRLESCAKVRRLDSRRQNKRIEAMLHVQKQPHVIWLTIVLSDDQIPADLEHSVELGEEDLYFGNVVHHHVHSQQVEGIVHIRKSPAIVIPELEATGLLRQVAHITAKDLRRRQLEILPNSHSDGPIRAADVTVRLDSVAADLFRKENAKLLRSLSASLHLSHETLPAEPPENCQSQRMAARPAPLRTTPPCRRRWELEWLPSSGRLPAPRLGPLLLPFPTLERGGGREQCR